MILNDLKVLRTNDVVKYSWSRIAQFQNIDHTVKMISALHNLGRKHQENARSQAEELKHCLSQAKEYFDAANAVSLSTKPVLLYYSAMSMALAEILLKQTGDSRLSKLRQEHNCHGLQLSIGSAVKTEDSLSQSASNLIIKAQTDIGGQPKGTFEVWRRSAREYPIGGKFTNVQFGGATTTGHRIICTAADVPPATLPKKGLSLLQCLAELPYLSEVLSSNGASLQMVRGAFNQTINQLKISTEFVLHPGPEDLIEKFGSSVQAEPAAVNNLTVIELQSGYAIRWDNNADLPQIRIFPASTSISTNQIFFSCSGLNLGEFGFLYLALHICGTFARYYPDIWLKHIEKNSPLAMAIDELCNSAIERLPLLLLSELSRIYHVHEQ